MDNAFIVLLDLICCGFDEYFPSMSTVDNGLQFSPFAVCISGLIVGALLAL